MSEFLAKIENFLFDILGLVLPGLIMIVILIAPGYFLDIPNIPKFKIETSYILSWLSMALSILANKWKADSNLLLTLLVILAYLLGHVVKVFSIILYDLLKVIFDRSVNALIIMVVLFIERWLIRFFRWIDGRELDETFVYGYVHDVLGPIRSTLGKIFVFSPPYFDKANKKLQTYCIATINKRLGEDYPDAWYSLFKISSIINSQKNGKSLADHFLAKYNLYRSLSFIFLFETFYLYYFFSDAADFIAPELVTITMPILILSGLLWFTFHYKYKRYWTLCGNERLVSLYYFLNKEKFDASGQNIVH